MLGNFTKDELDKAKTQLEGLKASKFALNAHKHKCDHLMFHDVRRHLLEEVGELQDVAYTSNSDLKLAEVADISNCCDILAMLILRKDLVREGKT